MTGRTRTEALLNEIDPIQKALNSITVGRLALVRGGLSTPDSIIEAVNLNRGEPAPLRSGLMGPLFLRVGLWIRITEPLSSQSTYQTTIARYSFLFLGGDGREFLGYHWNPFALDTGKTYPHLHVGREVSGRGNILPERFHKLHLPTGNVTAQSVVRFAIEEPDAQERSGMDREAVLQDLWAPTEGE